MTRFLLPRFFAGADIVLILVRYEPFTINDKYSEWNVDSIQDILTDDKGRLEASDSHRGLRVIAELGRPLPAPPEPRVLHILHDH